MKTKKNNDERVDLVPFPVIQAATEGDVEAINKVLKHYESFIISLSIRKVYDDFGQSYYCVDETLRRRLETKLITKILSFKIT